MAGETRDLINETDFPRRFALEGDEIIPGIDPVTGQPIAIPIQLLQTTATSLIFPSWASLNGILGDTAGQKAEVSFADGGTHADPVNGLTVSNSGVYSWSASPAGWLRVSNLLPLSVGQPIPYGPWVSGTVYPQNAVTTKAGSSYWSKALHVATSADEPGTGVDWEDLWLQIAAKGDTGATGATGATGDKGDKGDTGNNGSTWYSGTTIPSVGTGVNGDFYLRTTTGAIYAKSAGVWGLIGTFQGPAGPAATSTYDPPVAFRSKPGANEIIGFLQTRLDMTLQANFAGSAASIGVNPTASMVIRVFDCARMTDAGTQIGTVTFNTSGVPTFATTGGTEKVVAAGRCVKFLAPASVDATGEQISIVLAGDVTGAVLKLGSMSNQDANNVNITGGFISDTAIDGGVISDATIASLIAPLPVNSGGTGVATISALRTALGLPATAGVFPKMRYFDYTGGWQTYTKTTGTKRVRVWARGAGAGGRFATASGTDSGAGSGGGGEGAEGYTEIDVSALSGFTLFVGKGGDPDQAGSATLVGNTGQYLNLNGGAIGGAASGGGSRGAPGGLGGTVVTGGLRSRKGQAGAPGGGVEVYGNRWGNGGQGGGLGGGQGGNNLDGESAPGKGGGGGGGGARSGSTRNGGSGGHGEVVIEELAD